jgi:ferredoxin
VSLAPELFDVDDRGRAVVLVLGELTQDQEHAARAAFANCPEQALVLHDDRGERR